uniref:Uncharacterized protein n=1 Tax=Mustela putorius furo TaxID=9669 RepID=M3Y864_MUSPF
MHFHGLGLLYNSPRREKGLSLAHLSCPPWFPAEPGMEGFQHLGQRQDSRPAGPDSWGSPARPASLAGWHQRDPMVMSTQQAAVGD